MALICNDSCEEMIQKNHGTSVEKRENNNLLPRGIPASLCCGSNSYQLFELDYEERVEQTEPYQKIIRRVTLANEGLAVEMKACIYDKTAVDYTITIENTGKENSQQLTQINALDVAFSTFSDGPFDISAHLENPKYVMDDEKRPVLHLIRGNEGCKFATLEEMSEEFRAMPDHSSFAFDGTSCGGRYSPYFITSWPGGGVCLAVGWTGMWRAEFTNENGCIHMTAGMKRGNFYLRPGEQVRTPRIMYLPWEGQPEEGYNAFRRAYIRYIAPRGKDGEVLFPPISSPCPDENSTNGETEINWVQTVMDDTGAEMYWHDAWWHVGGFPAGMGNYTFPIEKCVDQERYPKGVKILGDIAHQKGYQFMLWFAPETFPENSTMAKEYPEFILKKPGAGGGTLNMANPDALDYMVRYLTECIQTYGVDIFRTDSGMDFEDILANEEPEREGILEIRMVEGLYRLWDELRRLNPGLMIDNCCGGGTRLDLELCSRSYSLWRTDSSVWYHGLGDMVRHPILNQSINASFNRFIPFTLSATCDNTPYTVRSGFNGGLTINMDLRRPDFDKSILRAAYAEVKRLRQYFLGDFYRLIHNGYDPYSWCAYQYHVPEQGKGCVLVFRRDYSPYSSAVIGLKALEPDKKYEVDFYEGYEKAKTLCLTGAQLMSYTVELESAPGSLLLEYREKPPRQWK